MKKDYLVFQNECYVLGWKNDLPYISIKGEEYKLSCHPYEPCLYITNKDDKITYVHNSFDPSIVLEIFEDGGKIKSITGMEYDALDFCMMVEYASKMYDIQIDDAEIVFNGRAKKKNTLPDKKIEETKDIKDMLYQKAGKIIEHDPFFDLLEEYPDSVIDFCLVKNEHLSQGYKAHKYALVCACGKLFIDENDYVIWNFDVEKAQGKQITIDELFAFYDENGEINYRKAFLDPPYTNNYTNADFDKLNSTLFPNGIGGLEVYKWTTDFSEYFDEGHEWWGSLCLTVYDKTLDRFIIIMASTTD